MQRPEVRLIEPQQYSEPQEVNISSAEAHALMLKYGIGKSNIPQPQQPQFVDTNSDLTFDQLIAIEEQKAKAERQRKEYERLQELNKPTPYSFDRNRIQYYNNDYRSIEDSGFGIEVKVVSDMPINKGYNY